MISFTTANDNKTMYVAREFKAPRQKVWDAWTKPELLDQWWGPKPWDAKTKRMEFKEGGERLYAMMGPEGQAIWGLVTYSDIKPPKSFRTKNNFTDEDGKLLDGFPTSNWLVEFTENDGVTSVKVTINHANAADLEQMVKMGFEGGFTICLNQLEEMVG